MTRELAAAIALFFVALMTVPHHLSNERPAAAGIAAGAALLAALLGLHERGVARMSKTGAPRRFKLDQVRQKVAEERGGATIEIEIGDEQVFSFPSPTFWSDEQLAIAKSNDVVALATSLLGGADRYAQFREAGGQASDVAMIMSEYAKEQGTTEGESAASPTS